MAYAIIATAQQNNRNVRRVVDTNSFPSTVPITTEPAASGQQGIVYANNGEYPSLIKVVPYASISTASTPGVRLIGWNSYRYAATNLCPGSESFATSGLSPNWVDASLTRNSQNVEGPTGTGNAMQITASGANGTLTQNLAQTSGDHVFSIYIRRVSGSGNIQITTNNFTASTTVTITTSWQRFEVSASSTTAHVGVRIVTSGDSIEVWGAQAQTGLTATDYIRTDTAATSGPASLWTPTLLAELTPAYNSTSGSIPHAQLDGARHFLFSALTVGGGVPTVNLYSPGTSAAAGTPPAHAIVDCVGSQIVTAQFKAGTSCNMGVLWYTI